LRKNAGYTQFISINNYRYFIIIAVLRIIAFGNIISLHKRLNVYVYASEVTIFDKKRVRTK